MTTSVQRLPDQEAVAAAVAETLARRLQALQSAGTVPAVVLTGGTVSRLVHRALAGAALDWARVELWWGDERYLPEGHEDRNEVQAHDDLVSRVAVDPARVHPMPADDGTELPAAAGRHAGELSAWAGTRGGEPWFDVLLLGIGEDGHCASLFPGRAEVADASAVVPVDGAPKPPPRRLSLGMPVLRRAREVWFVAAGDGKAGAVARSYAGGDVSATPAAGPRGLHSTTWWVDDAAAAHLPPDVRR